MPLVVLHIQPPGVENTKGRGGERLSGDEQAWSLRGWGGRAAVVNEC